MPPSILQDFHLLLVLSNANLPSHNDTCKIIKILPLAACTQILVLNLLYDVRNIGIEILIADLCCLFVPLKQQAPMGVLGLEEDLRSDIAMDESHLLEMADCGKDAY
jgi:hypothetical protein